MGGDHPFLACSRAVMLVGTSKPGKLEMGRVVLVCPPVEAVRFGSAPSCRVC